MTLFHDSESICVYFNVEGPIFETLCLKEEKFVSLKEHKK